MLRYQQHPADEIEEETLAKCSSTAEMKCDLFPPPRNSIRKNNSFLEQISGSMTIDESELGEQIFLEFNQFHLNYKKNSQRALDALVLSVKKTLSFF